MYELTCKLFRNMLSNAESFWNELKLYYIADEIFNTAWVRPLLEEIWNKICDLLKMSAL